MSEYTTHHLDAIMTAQSSISHGGETKSTTMTFRREKILLPSGEVKAIPVISGNSIRGVLRDASVLAMIEVLGLDRGSLSIPAFDFLFSGGSLNKDAGKSIDLKRARKFKELLPIVGLFGGSIGDQIIEGKLQIGKIMPICAETWHLIPDAARDAAGGQYADLTIGHFLQVESYTRRDDKKQENMRRLMNPEANMTLDGKAAKKREAMTTGSIFGKPDDGPPRTGPVDTEMGQHQQMRYSVETLAAGTKFYWWTDLRRVTDLEYEAFQTAIIEFQRRPYLGGKANIGHGRVDLDILGWGRLPTMAEVLEVEKPQVAGAYLQHLRDHVDTIRELLETL